MIHCHCCHRASQYCARKGTLTTTVMIVGRAEFSARIWPFVGLWIGHPTLVCVLVKFSEHFLKAKFFRGGNCWATHSANPSRVPARAAAFDLVPLIGFVVLCVAAINV